MPLSIASYLDINDPVLVFDQVLEGINLRKHISVRYYGHVGRRGYNPVPIIKAVLFGFMNGYISLRQLEDACRHDLRFIYLTNGMHPCYHTFENVINEVIGPHVEEFFNEINAEIFRREHVDLNHIYIDGTKLEANANKYSWVWKKAAVKARFRLYRKITSVLNEINGDLEQDGIRIETSDEYVPEFLEEKLLGLAAHWRLDESKFVHGSGHHKPVHQRWYEQLKKYKEKLEEYREKVTICGEGRNSYSKTDHSATFMRIKTDYMGNDQLLPAYNVQFGIADEYIAVLDVNQYRSDMDCFVPLMKKFYATYHHYPKYPVADAGYGSLNNYIFCKEHGMEKYMKFTMFKKETTDAKYRDNPFRVQNFKVDDQGVLRCPNNRAFYLLYRKPIKGNKYGRQEEIYRCEDCTGCPYADKCKRTPKNRTVRVNRELTAMQEEVVQNMQSTHGIMLRRNRAIQSEGTFGIVKNDHGYDRIVRRGMKGVKIEIYLIAIGQNLNKYYHKRMRIQKIA